MQTSFFASSPVVPFFAQVADFSAEPILILSVGDPVRAISSSKVTVTAMSSPSRYQLPVRGAVEVMAMEETVGPVVSPELGVAGPATSDCGLLPCAFTARMRNRYAVPLLRLVTV